MTAPRPGLEHFDLEQQRCTELVDEVDWFEVSGDGSRLVDQRPRQARASCPPTARPDPDADGQPADRVTVDLSRARFLADPAALWRHAYAEAGRLMRHDFWVADMAGVDWDAVLDAYRPLLDRIAAPTTSPTCCGRSSASSAPRTPTSCRAGGTATRREPPVGLLGADLERGADGAGG